MKMTLAMIVGTRDFFPAEPVLAARRSVLKLLAEMGVEVVILEEDATPMGAVETWEQAKQCAALFRAHRDRIDGILVVLPVFGPERAIADTIKLSELQVPILVQAYPDDPARLDVAHRGDAFCGKISVCNNLYQYGFPFSLTRMHTVDPGDESFLDDLRRFLGVCRVVRGLRRARIGAVGARPGIFNTVRYSEKLLQASGITVTTVDLSELFGAAGRLADSDPRVSERVEAIRDYIPASQVPAAALTRMARLAIALDDWIAANELDAVAFQCWTSIQQNYGVNACTVLSMLSEKLVPAACEVDVTGVVTMYALQLASGRPSALVDWNNNYGADPDRCILFHCGNWARSFVPEAHMANAEILATVLGQDATWGTVSGMAPAGPLTFARISTDDRRGCIKAYVGEGRFTADPLDTFGCRAVVEVPGLQRLLRYICRNGFEHHAAVSASHVAAILAEAFEAYLGWELYYHNSEV
ncbi:MAG: fucose isomerase [Anaerolineae bacterium]|nr:fucose isomerase [Anaerolineae bacterium]